MKILALITSLNKKFKCCLEILKIYLHLGIPKKYKQNAQQIVIIKYFLVFHHFYSFHSKSALEHLSFAYLTVECEITSCMYLHSLNFRMNNVFLEGEKEKGKRLWRKLNNERNSTAFVLKALMPQGEPKEESEVFAVEDEGWDECGLNVSFRSPLIV